MGQEVGTGAGAWQGVGSGPGHGGITCVLQTQFSILVLLFSLCILSHFSASKD